MNTKALGFIKWIGKMVLLLSVFAFAAAIIGKAQGRNIKPPPFISHPDHDTLEEMEETIRFKMITIISIEPRMIFWKKESKDRIDVGSFTYDDRSFVGNVQKGCYVALFCLTHDYVYSLYPCK